jgi:hypothetical protein
MGLFDKHKHQKSRQQRLEQELKHFRQKPTRTGIYLYWDLLGLGSTWTRIYLDRALNSFDTHTTHHSKHMHLPPKASHTKIIHRNVNPQHQRAG